MAGRSEVERLTLHLTPGEAALVAAALRQYEPYWSPDDIDAPQKLGELARDIRDLLDRLRAAEPSRPPGLLGTFLPRERQLRLAPSDTASDPEPPT